MIVCSRACLTRCLATCGRDGGQCDADVGIVRIRGGGDVRKGKRGKGSGKGLSAQRLYTSVGENHEAERQDSGGHEKGHGTKPNVVQLGGTG